MSPKCLLRNDRLPWNGSAADDDKDDDESFSLEAKTCGLLLKTPYVNVTVHTYSEVIQSYEVYQIQTRTHSHSLRKRPLPASLLF